MPPDPDTVSHYDFGVIGNLSRAEHKKHLFLFAFIVAEIFGIGACVVVGLWAGNYDFHTETVGQDNCTVKLAEQSGGHCYTKGGFGHFPSFDYHPFFMSLAFIFLIGQGLIVFRLFRGASKNVLKLVHLSVMTVSLVLMVLAIYSIAYVNKKGIRNVHDWIGLIAVVAFILQFVFGFLGKFFPGASPPIAAWYRPIHNFAGIVIFGLSCANAMMGMAIAGQNDYSTAGDLTKLFVICVLIYAVMIIFIVVNDEFKRTDEIEPEQARLVGGSYYGRQYQSLDQNHVPQTNGDGLSDRPVRMELTSKRKVSPSNSSRRSVSFTNESTNKSITAPPSTPIARPTSSKDHPDTPMSEHTQPSERSSNVKERPKRKKSPKNEESSEGDSQFGRRSPKRRTWHGKPSAQSKSKKKSKSPNTLLDWFVAEGED